MKFNGEQENDPLFCKDSIKMPLGITAWHYAAYTMIFKTNVSIMIECYNISNCVSKKDHQQIYD